MKTWDLLMPRWLLMAFTILGCASVVFITRNVTASILLRHDVETQRYAEGVHDYRSLLQLAVFVQATCCAFVVLDVSAQLPMIYPFLRDARPCALLTQDYLDSRCVRTTTYGDVRSLSLVCTDGGFGPYASTLTACKVFQEQNVVWARVYSALMLSMNALVVLPLHEHVSGLQHSSEAHTTSYAVGIACASMAMLLNALYVALLFTDGTKRAEWHDFFASGWLQSVHLGAWLLVILLFNLRHLQELLNGGYHGKAKAVDIFISFRFAEAYDEAMQLKTALESRGKRVFLSNVLPGGNLQEAIYTALDRCQLCVCLASETYGKSTTSFSTYHELNYVINERIAFFLVKMCDRWAEPSVRGIFGDRTSYLDWRPGNPMPIGTVDMILTKLNKEQESLERKRSDNAHLRFDLSA